MGHSELKPTLEGCSRPRPTGRFLACSSKSVLARAASAGGKSRELAFDFLGVAGRAFQLAVGVTDPAQHLEYFSAAPALVLVQRHSLDLLRARHFLLPDPFLIQASESAAQHRQSALFCIVNECRNGEKCYIRLSERTGFRGQKQHSPVAGKEGKRAHFPRAPIDWPKEILRRVVLLNYCFSV